MGAALDSAVIAAIVGAIATVLAALIAVWRVRVERAGSRPITEGHGTFRAAVKVLMEATELAVIWTDRQGIVTDWNSGAIEMFGYHASDMIGNTLAPIMSEGDYSAHRLRYPQVMAEGHTNRRGALRMARHRDGRTVPVLVDLHMFHLGSRGPTVMAIVRKAENDA